MAKTIMLQGTSSNVGKSIITTALCRIFLQDGYKVTPFKAQNMALNSYVTKDGGEMGRAQVAQAEAAGIEPDVKMNPVLLKPCGDACSQVVLMGKPIGVMSAQKYHTSYSITALKLIGECITELKAENDIMVIEGAGSPAEVNLKANDIVNMRIAKLAQAPVLLIADIDRGGALAAVVGTLELLEPEERDLVKGIIINKFRGDIKLLEPAITFLEDKIGKPVLGVIPHIEIIGIDEEDSVVLDEKQSETGKEIEIAVIRIPTMSNFTDFDALAAEGDVNLRYVKKGEKIGQPDLIILPGSKNTIEDLKYIYQQRYDQKLLSLNSAGTPVIGICGGYQMLGREIQDPEHTESAVDKIDGLGLLDTITKFETKKITHQVSVRTNSSGFLSLAYQTEALTGYEIHMGITKFNSTVKHPFIITSRSGEATASYDGAVRTDGLVMGTYIHGIFDNDGYRRAIINALRVRKGLEPLCEITDRRAQKEVSYNNVANIVRSNLKMELLYKIMDEK